MMTNERFEIIDWQSALYSIGHEAVFVACADCQSGKILQGSGKR